MKTFYFYYLRRIIAIISNCENHLIKVYTMMSATYKIIK